MKWQWPILTAAVAVVTAVVFYCLYMAWWYAANEVVEVSQYSDAPEDQSLKLVDDRLEDKNPVFDETLVDSRPLGEWEVNSSAAVVRLDCPRMLPDQDAALLNLQPSYAAAIQAAKEHWHEVLPSANLLDGSAKQFDDGLYAAVDLACFKGELGLAPAVPQFVAEVFAKLPEGSPARPFLGAALEIAGRKVKLTPAEDAEKGRLLRKFDAEPVRSKPIAFYTWTPELQQLWRFYRFLQYEFPLDRPNELAVPRAIAQVLKQDQELLGQYRAVNAFYAHLTNPLICLPVDALIDAQGDLVGAADRLGARRTSVAVLPPSTSRETELMDRLFAMGVPPGTNVMTTFIQAILAGKVDLAPKANDGWYQYQVYALETMLMPSRGQEGEKLLLTARYKKRLVEAFKALMTKRRETHARQAATGEAAAAAEPEPPRQISPRLRVEPCATFYLRTARAYAFLENFLLATAGRERLQKLHGLKEGGPRELNLADELGQIKLRFYGFYLLSCEDLGMRPKFLADEAVDQAAAMQAALGWLEKIQSDPDLACDTRVAVPALIDPQRNTVRLWATLGVRLAKLEAA